MQIVETTPNLKRSRRRRVLATVFALAVSTAIFTVIWYQVALKPTGADEQTVVITEAASIAFIADALEAKKLIKSSTAFRFYVWRHNVAKDFKSGRYALSGSSSTPEIANALTDVSKQNQQFTVKEGQTQKQIAELLAKRDAVDKGEFEGLKVKDFSQYSFLAGVPDNASLEGFLFPETYHLPAPDTPTRAVAEIMLTQFGQELTPEMQGQIKQSGRSLYQTIIVASIVEEEVRSDADRRLVAGIIYRRLAESIRLDADATVRYGLNKPSGALTKSDLDSNNPYNTRKFKGLPPGPICNPGLSSIKAAIDPESSDYLFYLSAPDGRTVFAKTLEEHDANVQKYLR